MQNSFLYNNWFCRTLLNDEAPNKPTNTQKMPDGLMKHTNCLNTTDRIYLRQTPHKQLLKCYLQKQTFRDRQRTLPLTCTCKMSKPVAKMAAKTDTKPQP